MSPDNEYMSDLSGLGNPAANLHHTATGHAPYPVPDAVQSDFKGDNLNRVCHTHPVLRHDPLSLGVGILHVGQQ